MKNDTAMIFVIIIGKIANNTPLTIFTPTFINLAGYRCHRFSDSHNTNITILFYKNVAGDLLQLVK